MASEPCRVLGLFGSPRREGNTAQLLNAFLRGAKEGGAQVEALQICDLRIVPCRGCLSCFGDGHCVIADDMQRVYALLQESHVVALASPVYFCGLTAWAKALVDRSQALWARKHILGHVMPQPTGKGFFISTGGSGGEKVFTGALMTVRYFFDAANIAFAGSLLFPSVDAMGEILKCPGALQQAFAMGKRAVAVGGEEPGQGRASAPDGSLDQGCRVRSMSAGKR